jgi:hypothetical protein
MPGLSPRGHGFESRWDHHHRGVGQRLGRPLRERDTFAGSSPAASTISVGTRRNGIPGSTPARSTEMWFDSIPGPTGNSGEWTSG